MPLTSGQLFAGFTIVRLLGSGGMGEVYLAEHPRLPRRDALKILPPEVSANDEFRSRFNREADLASTLYHPHIVGVHDRGECDGQLWISMDYVDGPDTGHLLKERYPAGMPSDEVFEIVAAVADALDYAHDRGLLHRDVKPANILLTRPEHDTKRILLADFGIARRLDDISGLTATNMAVGTVSYAAPEQLMDAEVDAQADQYSLAATAFHLLTGVPPFDHSNPAVVISRHLNQQPPSLRDMRPELATHGNAVARGLAKDPRERFQSCRAFADALRHGDEGQGQRPQGPAVALTRPSPRTPRDHANGDSASSNALRSETPTPSQTRSSPTRVALYSGLALVAVATVVLIVLILALPSGSPQTSAPSSPQVAPSSAPGTAAASLAPACGDGPALLASMTTRDKLAQLLMVGVTGAADAKAVADGEHVGGILITGSTDLSMLSDGTIADIADKGPLPLAVSVDEEGGRVSRLASLIGSQPSPRVLAATHTPDEVY
ncbi:serine/threonine protein kinase, partial [Mycobacterium sp. OAS707]|uniref:protein kinase domain-containing protein n=1 Tax=Mycobacterium sp. OAS707 TaxID=2663822 RepID=UPI0019F93014